MNKLHEFDQRMAGEEQIISLQKTLQGERRPMILTL